MEPLWWVLVVVLALAQVAVVVVFLAPTFPLRQLLGVPTSVEVLVGARLRAMGAWVVPRLRQELQPLRRPMELVGAEVAKMPLAAMVLPATP